MLALSAGDARPAQGDTVTLSVLSFATQRPGLDVLIANFERVYPNINVDVTYAPSTAVRDQLESTQLAAGSAPDVLSVSPGCFKSAAVCPFAKAGHLAPMVNKPWVKWSVPVVTSLDKYGQGLYAFSPQLAFPGIFTNDDLFKKLGLKVPQTFAQLLDFCQKAKAAGTVAVISSSDAQEVSNLLVDLAVANALRQGQSMGGQASGRKGELRRDTRLAPGATGVHRHEQRRLLPAGSRRCDGGFGARAVRPGAGPDGFHRELEQGPDRRRQSRSSASPTIRSRAGPGRTRRRPFSTSRRGSASTRTRAPSTRPRRRPSSTSSRARSRTPCSLRSTAV